jgi:hypothetical protein
MKGIEMITITDAHGRPNPQSPSDCLAHCEVFISASDFELAITLIELLIHKHALEALQGCLAAFRPTEESP